MLGFIAFTLAGAFASDSLRMETINGKPYVVYQVGAKETLYSISRRYGATIASVLEQNPNADAGLEVGQILKIPYTPVAKAQPAVQTSAGLVHKVAAKETLFSIARMYSVSVDDLKAWNNLKDNALSVGQEIVVRKNAPPNAAPATSPSGAKTHTVAPKETMFSIAKLYGMTVPQLKEWNNITGDELKVGQVLAVAVPVVTAPVAAVPVGPTQAPLSPLAGKDTTIHISEGIGGADEMKETGMAELIDGSDGNRKYLAQHRTIKAGTILKIRNTATSQEVFVRVTGPITGGEDAVMIRISRSAYDRLGATEPKFRAEIIYYK